MERAARIGLYVLIIAVSLLIITDGNVLKTVVMVGGFVLFAFLAGGVVGGIYAVRYWLGMGEMRKLQQRVKQAETEAHLRELLARWEQGERSLELKVGISLSYNGLNQYEQAETFAQQVCAEIDLNTRKRRKPSRRAMIDSAHLALAIARIYQGKFSEAAQGLNAYRPHGLLHDTLAAWSGFASMLADDNETALNTVAEIKPGKNAGLEHHLADHMRFMVAYMRYRLWGDDTTAQLYELRDQFGAWRGEFSQNNNPIFRARLYPLLENISTLIPGGWFSCVVMRIRLGQTAEVIAEYEAKRAEGDRSLETALALSAAYGYTGDAVAAEPLAREVYDAVTRAAAVPEPSPQRAYSADDWQRLVDLAHVTLFDGLLAQGRYAEAADCLTPRILESLHPNRNRVSVTWAHYLAGNMEQARAMLATVKPSQDNFALNLTPRQQLLVAYLQYKLGMADSAERVIARQHYIVKWNEEIDRIIDSPYRRALQDMVTDIRAITDGIPQAPAEKEAG